MFIDLQHKSAADQGMPWSQYADRFISKKCPELRTSFEFNNKSVILVSIAGVLKGSVYRPHGRKWAVVMDTSGKQVAATLSCKTPDGKLYLAEETGIALLAGWDD